MNTNNKTADKIAAVNEQIKECTESYVGQNATPQVQADMKTQLEAILTEHSLEHTIDVRAMTWTNMYPNLWDRLSAYVALRVLGLRRSYTELKWYHAFFNYRMSLKYPLESMEFREYVEPYIVFELVDPQDRIAVDAYITYPELTEKVEVNISYPLKSDNPGI